MLLKCCGVLFIFLIQCEADTNDLVKIQLNYFQPEQTHLAFGDNTSEIVIIWSTRDKTESLVEYGEFGLNNRAKGSSKLFVDGGDEKRSQWIHKVTLRNLEPATSYAYHCGSTKGWSDLFFFKTLPAGNDFKVTAAIYGDMGNDNAKSLTLLQEDVQTRDLYNLIIHVGDFAYDLDTDNGRVGDAFMRQIEPIAAYVPYMTCPGNHEEKYNFSSYKHRFPTPNSEQDGRMYYSLDLGPVHLISINTEAYMFLQYGGKIVAKQYEWLEKDLKRASKPKNRAKRPWIVIFGHRPMYCSNSDDIDCDYTESPTRVGLLPFLHLYGLEPLLWKYGVDLAIWAHEHSYERTWPLYNYKVYNGTNGRPYLNAGAPIHIVTGSAGCVEGRDRFHFDPRRWSAYRSQDYGFTRFAAMNKTHIYMEQISVDLGDQIIDSFWIVKYKQSFGIQ